MVQMTYRKNLNNIGKRRKLEPKPLLLYGYGAYGHCIDPYFSPSIFSLLDRGFIQCIANVRGGSEKGYDWYLDGKMGNKMNTFLDFISCAEYLIDNKYTSPDKLVIEGRSAGGLLVGAVLTMRPDLFKTVILGVPFLDVLVTMSDPSIPLTTGEWIEWGNPNNQKDHDYMAKYSPIDNIRKTNYPNTLITCGLFDPRVQYWEPLKFQVKLKNNCTDTNMHLIKIDTDNGHYSNADRYKACKERAFEYAFMLKTIIN
jgi:oligopeptidase B